MSEKDFSDIVAAVRRLPRQDLLELRSIIDVRITHLLMGMSFRAEVSGQAGFSQRGTKASALTSKVSPAKVKPKKKGPAIQISKYLNVPEYIAFRDARKLWLCAIKTLRKDKTVIAPLTESQQRIRIQFEEAKRSWHSWKATAGLAMPTQGVDDTRGLSEGEVVTPSRSNKMVHVDVTTPILSEDKNRPSDDRLGNSTPRRQRKDRNSVTAIK